MDFVLALYMALLVMNVLVLIFLIFSTNALTRLIRIPSRFLGVGILMLSFVGVYSLRNSVTDCAIAAGIGLFGMILRRLDLPIVPIILGMVLGDIMEQRLKVAAVRIQSPLDWFDRPISAILIILIGALLASAIWGRIRPKKNNTQHGEPHEKVRP